MNHIHHWIDGRIVESTSGRTAPVYDPARGEQSGEVDLANAAEVDSTTRPLIQCSMLSMSARLGWW